jgi:hypothetical protein
LPLKVARTWTRPELGAGGEPPVEDEDEDQEGEEDGDDEAEVEFLLLLLNMFLLQVSTGKTENCCKQWKYQHKPVEGENIEGTKI